MAIVKLNNDLKELYAKEQEEIQVILANLSEEAAQYIEEIRVDPAAASTLSVCGSPHSCPVARSTTAEQTWLPPMSTPRA